MLLAGIPKPVSNLSMESEQGEGTVIYSKKEATDAALKKELDDIASRTGLRDIEDALRFPKYFQIETTRVCNASCVFCPKEEWDKSTPFMSEKLFDKICEELQDYKDWVEFVDVQRAGEPLLDKNIVERVRKLKDIGMHHVCFSTNGSLMNEEKCKALLEAGIDGIMFSIDSLDRDKYSKMRVGLDFDTVMANILNCFKIRESYRPEMQIRIRGVSFYDLSLPDHQAELSDWEEYWAKWRKPQDRVYMKRVHNWGNQKDVGGDVSDNPDVYHPCVLPWSTMHITSMGSVPLCPQDFDAKMRMGDVNTDSIVDIWSNDAWSRVRRLHASGLRNEIPFCCKCLLFDLENQLEDWRNKYTPVSHGEVAVHDS